MCLNMIGTPKIAQQDPKMAQMLSLVQLLASILAELGSTQLKLVLLFKYPISWFYNLFLLKIVTSLS